MGGIELDRAYPGLFSKSDAHLMESLQGPEMTFGPRQRVVRANEPLGQSVYLRSGFVGRYRSDRQGRRQILALQIPGDFVDLPSYVLGHLDHDVETLGNVSTTALPHQAIGHLKQSAPALYDKLWRISLMDAAIHRYWVFRVGRLVGRVRIANFFAETLVRLYARGLCGLDGYVLPINQSELGEICGMTAVHANRMIGELRAEGICTFADSQVRLDDFAALVAAGQYDWDYLFLPDAISLRLSELAGRKSRPAGAGDEHWTGQAMSG